MQNRIEKNYQTNVNFYPHHKNIEFEQQTQAHLHKPHNQAFAASSNLLKRTTRYSDQGSSAPPQTQNDSGIIHKAHDKQSDRQVYLDKMNAIYKANNPKSLKKARAKSNIKRKPDSVGISLADAQGAV